ncbi:hypothetical protein ACFVH6_22300 [Spirillospora sp. NPDC127200]
MSGIVIDDFAMREEVSGHTADVQDDGTWTVSWLPDVALDRNQAISALMIAQVLAAGGGLLGGLTVKGRAVVASLAGELGLSELEAAERLAAGGVR